MKTAVVCLTPGYTNIEDYSNLLRRTEQISVNHNPYLYDVEFIVYHSGPVLDEHKLIISQHTWLSLIFIDVSSEFKSSDSGMFWVYGLWDHVKQYDRVIRIDEYCFIDSSKCFLNDIIDSLNDMAFVFPAWGDIRSEDDNLRDFTKSFIDTRDEAYVPSPITHTPIINICGFNVSLMRQHKHFFDYIDMVKRTNGMYLHGWSDSSVWGELVCFIDILLIDVIPSITYYNDNITSVINS